DPARGILRREPLAAALTGFGKPARASLYLERKDPDHTGDDLPLRHVFRIAVESDRLGKDRAPYPCFLPGLALRGLGLGPVAHRPALGDDPAPGVTAGDEKDPESAPGRTPPAECAYLKTRRRRRLAVGGIGARPRLHVGQIRHCSIPPFDDTLSVSPVSAQPVDAKARDALPSLLHERLSANGTCVPSACWHDIRNTDRERPP